MWIRDLEWDGRRRWGKFWRREILRAVENMDAKTDIWWTLAEGRRNGDDGVSYFSYTKREGEKAKKKWNEI